MYLNIVFKLFFYVFVLLLRSEIYRSIIYEYKIFYFYFPILLVLNDLCFFKWLKQFLFSFYILYLFVIHYYFYYYQNNFSANNFIRGFLSNFLTFPIVIIWLIDYSHEFYFIYSYNSLYLICINSFNRLLMCETTVFNWLLNKVIVSLK